MQVYNDEHLYHTGVKGMKWGKRIAAPIMGNKVGNKMANSLTNYHINRQKKKDVAKNSDSINNKKSKKSVSKHKAVGAKHVGNALKILGANVMAVNRNNQAMRISKMITPD